MLILDKWTLTGTLTLLSHPERARTVAIKEINDSKHAQQQEEQRRRYTEAYQELMDEISGSGDESTNSIHKNKIKTHEINKCFL
jgi:hypothetical protein